jgi:hypothetical protein
MTQWQFVVALYLSYFVWAGYVQETKLPARRIYFHQTKIFDCTWQLENEHTVTSRYKEQLNKEPFE